MAVIQPRWDIEEKANIFRRLVCFRPPHPPMRTDKIEHESISSFGILFEMESNINRGAIFCQQAIIIPFKNGRPLRTSGNQR